MCKCDEPGRGVDKTPLKSEHGYRVLCQEELRESSRKSIVGYLQLMFMYLFTSVLNEELL